MAADGPCFNRQLSAGQSARMVHFNSAFYTAPNYQVRMAMRVMLLTGHWVSECLSLRLADLRLN